MNDSSQLGPQQRRAALARLRDEVFDVVVIGGGATGAGLRAGRGHARADRRAGRGARLRRPARRRAARKLVHGGLRYLEQRDFGLVREALRERGLLLNVLAPHLVTPVPFLLPLTEHWQRAYIGAGLALYDSLGGHEGLPRHRHLTRRGALKIAPALQARTRSSARSSTTTPRSTTPATR